MLKNNVKCQCHNDACLWKGLGLSNNVCEYEVNQLSKEKDIRGKWNFNANCYDADASRDGISPNLKKSGIWLQPPCSQSFSGLGSRSGSSFKMKISGPFPIICLRKLDFCIHWHGKCCFRPKMHNIKVQIGDNKQ